MSEMHERWRCHAGNCGYTYDPARGDQYSNVSVGVAFEDISNAWLCPICGATKRSFLPMAEEVTKGVSLMSEMHEIWRCHVGNCGYMYDPARGDKRSKIAMGVAFEELPETWLCPVCGASKRSFIAMATEVIS